MQKSMHPRAASVLPALISRKDWMNLVLGWVLLRARDLSSSWRHRSLLLRRMQMMAGLL